MLSELLSRGKICISTGLSTDKHKQERLKVPRFRGTLHDLQKFLQQMQMVCEIQLRCKQTL